MSAPELLPQDADLLAKVFRVRLVGEAGPAPPAPLVSLPELASELLAEQQAAAAAAPRWADMPTRRSLVDRVVVSFLSSGSAAPNAEPLLDRLVACYQRGLDERRRQANAAARAGAAPAPEGAAELLEYALELCVSYASVGLLNPELFPQPPSAAAQGAERLLVLLEADLSTAGALAGASAPALPSGFLARLTEHAAGEGLIDELAAPLFGALHARMASETILTTFTAPLRALVALLECKPMRGALVRDARFMPTAAAPLPRVPPQLALAAARLRAPPPGAPPNGRAFEGSLLGPFFRPCGFVPESVVELLEAMAGGGAGGGDLSHLPSHQLFSDVSKRTRAQLDANITVLRVGSRTLVSGLHAALGHVLRSKESQGALLAWVGGAIGASKERATEWWQQGQGDGADLASLGFMFNLCWALLKLCEPFADPRSAHASKIDPTFLLSKHRFDTSKETKLHASEDALMHWLDPRNEDARDRYLRHMASEGVGAPAAAEAGGGGGGSGGGVGDELAAVGDGLEVSASFGTISEFFFCAMRAMHVTVIPAFERMAKVHERSHAQLDREVRRLRDAAGGAETADLAAAERELDKALMRRLAFEAHMCDKEFTAEALRYYLLVMTWLLGLACGEGCPTDGAGVPQPTLPLGPAVPRLFRVQPEHTMDDAVSFVKYVGRYDPAALDALSDAQLSALLTFITAFLGAPRFLHNPYLRAHLTEVLELFVPAEGGRGARGGASHAQSRLHGCLASHALARAHLAPALMAFFVDIEFTGSHTQFYDKFHYRRGMAAVLERLWEEPEHRAAIVGVAGQADKFVRFINFILNDALYCMDEALTKLAKIREVQRQQDDAAAWAALPDAERTERSDVLRQAEEQAGYYMQLANRTVHMLNYLTTDGTIVCVLMRPELASRVAMMLNSFVLRLVGPQCLELKVREPDKYHFNPRNLLVEIAEIYIHLAKQPELPQAIISDQRSYRPDLFQRAHNKVLRYMLKEEQLHAFHELVGRCAEAAAHEVQMEEDLGETPDEFACQITYELMSDPVLLPSSGVHVEKAAIMRHLLSDETDPFNRSRLTADMLQPADELKAKIGAWKAERLAQRTEQGGGGGGTAPMAVDG